MDKGDKIRVNIPEWLMKSNDLLTRELIGEAKIITNKAVFIHGFASVRKSERCLRCGKEIKNEVSIHVGHGPTCSEKLGIPREFDPEQDLMNIKQKIAQKTKVELWLPLSQVECSVVEESEFKEVAGETETKEEEPQKETPELYAEVEGRWIYLHTPYKYKDLCKSIQGRRWDKKKKCWKYPVSPTIAESIVSAFLQVSIANKSKEADELETTEEFDELVRQNIEIKSAAALKDREDLKPIPCTKFPAWTHQLQAFRFAEKLPAAMLAMDMGTGKSKVTVDLIVNRGHKKTLIICPKSVLSNVWPGEFEKHAGKDIKVVALDQRGTKKKLDAAKEEMAKAERSGEPIVFVINYESVWRDPFGEWAIKKAGFDLVVLDESHRIKSPGGKASRFIGRLGKRVDYRLCLTGTPFPHSPLDVYGQYRFLDPGIYGTSFNRFKQEYAVMGGYGGYEVMGYKHERELHDKFFSIAYKCDADDVLDLPDKVHVTRYCNLSSKALKKYKQLERDFITKVNGKEVTALNALTKLLRLQQMTSGYLVDDEGEVNEVDSSKKNLLSDVMEDLKTEEPVVIFARFRQDLDNIREVCEKQGRRYCELSGRSDDLDDWKNEKYDVIGVQIQSGGVGVDLTRSRYAIYYSVGYSLGDYQQSLARIHRPGQEQNTTFIHLVSKNTVDEKVEAALNQKAEIIDYILDGIK